MLYQVVKFAGYGLSSYWRRALITALVLAAVLVTILWVRGWQQSRAEADSPGTERYASLSMPYGEAVVHQRLVDERLAIPKWESEFVYKLGFVYDGDTLYSASSEKIRLYGIDTPEIGERCASEATHELRRVVLGGFLVEEGPRRVGPYGRSLYYLYTPDGESIDLHMVANGFAHAFTRDGQHKDVLVEAERLAREHRVGCLWE